CAGLAGLSEVAAVEAVLKAANAWESVFHETPSGVDVAAALAGAPIWFLRGQPPEHLSCGVPLQLAIALAGPPASTSRMVRGVRELRHAEPERVEALIADISTLAQAARQALAQGDLATLGAAMNSNHHAL